MTCEFSSRECPWEGRRQRKLMSLLSFVFSMMLMSCSQKPTVTVEPIHRSAVPQFGIKGRGYNRLSGLIVETAEARETQWEVRLRSFQRGEISYGVAGKFPQQGFEIEQVFPESGKTARPLSPNTKYYLTIICQFDQWVGASRASFYYSFVTDASGKVANIFPISSLGPRDQP